MGDGFLSLLTIVALALICLHIWVTVKRMVHARWDRYRQKRHVSPKEMWGYWLMLGALVALAIALLVLGYHVEQRAPSSSNVRPPTHTQP